LVDHLGMLKIPESFRVIQGL